MATLEELSGLYGDGDLANKVSAAVIITVKARLDGTPTAADNKYASKVFQNPQREAVRIMPYMLALYADQPLSAITGATDPQIQTAADAAVPIMIAADEGL